MPYEQCNGADLYFEDEQPANSEAGSSASSGLESNNPIVLLPGVTTGIRFFDEQLSGLSGDHHTVALDYRGHGRSEKTEIGHTVPQYARDLRSFLDQRDLEDVVLVGWSMGALVAWEYLDQFGADDIAGLVVVDMAATAFDWDDSEYGGTDLERLTDVLELVQTDHSSLVEMQMELTFKDPPSPEIQQLVFDETTRTPPPIKSAILFDYTVRDYREVLPNLDVPALVCAGADEKWRSVASVEHVARLLPNAEFERFEESGHCLSLEEPDHFNRVVGEFVDSI
ncbi:alpha/beta fold hydrolase [Halorussus halophilus]|uniref:alpha/beta fold hydrolase n=1 Tax=Halorussus halophilus TaxID=2650975 RepID=UPI0013017B50|nr:alpha/beta hydrolase [Halorussus halophilus]